MDVEKLKEASFEYLLGSPIGEELENLMSTYEKIQETLLNLVENSDEAQMQGIRTGTVLTFAVLNRIAEGKKIKDFTNEDWFAIAKQVADQGINIDQQEYVAVVFLTYASYIEVSAGIISEFVSKDKALEIKALGTEIRKNTVQLVNGDLSEAQYVESCMWISLEAMIKLLAGTIGKFACSEVSHMIDGITSFAFEYGRLALYERELALVNYYLDCQKQLDEELQNRYDAYVKDLSSQAEMFMNLVDNAFETDIRLRLKGSVELARAMGVKDEDILDSVDKVDEFFL